jgi:uncharacterized protein HemX/uroporphyrinogen-III synthase
MLASPATLLVTRPQAQAVQWVAQLREHGVPAQALPLIAIDPPEDAQAVQAAWMCLTQYQLLVFVSPSAVEQFFAQGPAPAAWPEGVQVATPGPGTDEALARAGVPETLRRRPADDAEQLDSEALWEVLRHDDWDGRRVLVVRGEGGRPWLAQQLEAAGATVEFLSAYRRRVPLLDDAERKRLREALADPAGHAWLFSSSQAIDHLVELVHQQGLHTDWSRHRAVVTHPRIGERAQALGLGRVEASHPAPTAVVDAWARLQGDAARGLDTMKDTVSDTSSPPAPASPSASSTPSRSLWWVAVVGLLVLSVVAVVLAYQTHQQLRDLERELVARQQASQDLATEARALARQAQDAAREASAKAAVLETRLAEVALQRDQLDDLLQALSRSRDENVLIEIEAGIRVALQQAGLTGSAEPLVTVLKSADERLQRLNQPRLERVRRAIAQDVERVRAVAVADVPSLVGRLDEAARLADELPLLSSPGLGVAERAMAESPEPAASAAQDWPARGLDLAGRVWQELRSLVRVTRIDRPEAMLMAPEQAFFLRENLKLRVLNARLALLSRQFDTVQADVRQAQQALDRYFDPRSRRVIQVADTLRQVQAQARASQLPRPDETLSALQAAAAGR